MRVLSLFDGISCGHVALERAGIPVEVYYASEIDEYAIQITQKNYVNTIQLGDVTSIDFNDFKGKVDLIIGGSPCQDLSIAGKRAGLKGERSGLFYKFVEAIEVIRPKYFLFENVASMKQEEKDLISSYLKVEPILINSALVSAQDRKRLYWTNISNVTQPEDKHIYLEDIVEPDALIDRDKSHAILASVGRTTHREYFKKNQGQLVYIAIMLSNIYGGFKEKKPRVKVDKSFCIRTSRGGGHLPSLIIEEKSKEITLENFKQCIRKVTPLECERLQTLEDEYTKYGIDFCSCSFYNGNECNVIKGSKKWNYVELRDVINRLQVEKQSYVTNTTYDLYDMEQLNLLVKRSIKIENVNMKDVNETLKLLWDFALNIIRSGSGNNQLILPKNVKFVMNLLDKDVEICVLNTINNGLNTEMLYSMKKENVYHTETMDGNIIKQQMVDGFIKLLPKKYLEESCKKEKLYIILIWINLIIAKIIFMSVKTTDIIYLSIDNLNKLQQNWSKMELLGLKMGYITEISNTSRYKAIGNGWTVDVIAHIFSFIGDKND